MTHGSLFSGIGGIDLGFEWAGIETKWQVEIDDYCQKLLSLRFPHTKKFTDVRKVGSHNLEKVDIISGGFPCQDISVAGKGAGLEGERSGLWTELHRVISELRPRFAFIENVPMLTIRGGTRVIADLAEIGYDCEWQVIGADDVGAWHRRKRIWITAYPKCLGWSKGSNIKRNDIKREASSKSIECGKTQFNANNVPDTNGKRRVRWANDETDRCSRYINRKSSKILSTNRKGYTDVPDTESERYGRRDSEECGIEGREFLTGKQGRSKMGSETQGCGESPGDVPDTDNSGSRTSKSRTDGDRQKEDERWKELSQPESGGYSEDVPDSLGKRGCSGDTAGKDAEDVRQLRGSPPYGYWDTEPNVGRVANGIPNRVDRLKGLGNAIVPQVAQIIMERIKESGGK